MFAIFEQAQHLFRGLTLVRLAGSGQYLEIDFILTHQPIQC